MINRKCLVETLLSRPSVIEFFTSVSFLTIAVYLSSVTAMLMGVAFLSLFERKMMGVVQYRLGPNKVSNLHGVIQPFSDAVKLASKQAPIPSSGEGVLYGVSPVIMCMIYLVAWCIPLTHVCQTSKSLVILLALLSCSALWQAISGWAANSAYSSIGSVRAIAQAISFEIVVSVSMLTFIFLSMKGASNEGSSDSSFWLGGLNMVAASLLLLGFLAESGRGPFDLPEGESELVGGYLVDYGGGLYKLIFLAENLACLLIGGVITFVCFPPLSCWKCLAVMTLVILIRSSMPRISFRSMMPLVWVTMLPLLISAMATSMLTT
uniref:NADH-ubiquinone oxidoreductase chain 1 n=1 Tax=Hoplopleura sp. TaxID=2782173 RepID=A0A7S8WWF5_9NEOP|nr:NADH dehydrogenase subunit 1 [Hoplopleura sp.]